MQQETCESYSQFGSALLPQYSPLDALGAITRSGAVLDDRSFEDSFVKLLNTFID